VVNNFCTELFCNKFVPKTTYMKKYVLALLTVAIAINSFAQKKDGAFTPAKGKGYCHKLYLTTSTGINNSTGILGLSLDAPVARSISIEGGAGFSTWGYKLTAGGKYYFKPCHRGWALGTGITYNTGLASFQNTMETTNGVQEKVILNLKPQTNLYFAAYSYVNLGKNKNRFYTMFGWSIPLSSDHYVQTAGTEISENSKKVMNILAPGGLILGIGFSFGVN
jgi:hypothetical protein